MKKGVKFLIRFIVLLLLAGNLFGQIKLIELPNETNPLINSSILINTSERTYKNINDGWSIYPFEKRDQAVSVKIPFNFSGVDKVICEKELFFDVNQLIGNKVSVNFLGINYAADIVFNDVVLYKHSGGEFPFSVEIPVKSILIEAPNLLIVKISYIPSYDRSIPLNKGFLLPENFGGITRDVFLSITPNINTQKFNVDYSVDNKSVNGTVKLFVENGSINNYSGDLSAKISFSEKISGRVAYSNSKSFSSNGFTTEVNIPFKINSVDLWSNESQPLYLLKTEIYKADSLIDIKTEQVSFTDIKLTDENLTLNGSPFNFHGVTYIQNDKTYGNIAGYQKLYSDLMTIKNNGFNTVRFSKQIVNPYALKICENIGLFVFADIPINSVPETITQKEEFIQTVKTFTESFVTNINTSNNLVAIGTGNSYLSNSPIHKNAIKEIAGFIKENSSKLVYTSFIGLPTEKIENVDLYGIELFAKNIKSFSEDFGRSQSILGKKRMFVSSVIYPVYYGQANGYSVDYSFEAQAKYFLSLINFVDNNSSSAIFFDGMFDYIGSHSSLYAGYHHDKIFKTGIVSRDQSSNRLSSTILQKKLINKKDTSIPIGSVKDESPVFFIIIGLVLSLATGLLINSKRKMREDASRALLRPYNFFADIRDHRILSGIHSSILMVLLAGSHGLLLANLLFYLKSNILLEKIVSSFGIIWFSDLISFLAWNPIDSFLYISLFSILVIISLTIIAKLFSLMIRNIVLTTSIYFTIIWSFLPIALMLPLEIILYRILALEFANYYIYAFLGIILLWQLQRMIKGIYVIFDVHPWKVHFYSFLMILVTVGGTILYYQFTEGTIYYIINSFKQFQLM